MSLSFTIGGVSYATHSIASGRKALDIAVSAPNYDVRRFHPPGVDGNLIIRMGRTGQKITATVRYIGDSLSAARALYRSDREAFANTAVTIVDDEGQTITNCNMMTCERASPPKATGRAVGQTFFDATMVFTRD